MGAHMPFGPAVDDLHGVVRSRCSVCTTGSWRSSQFHRVRAIGFVTGSTLEPDRHAEAKYGPTPAKCGDLLARSSA